MCGPVDVADMCWLVSLPHLFRCPSCCLSPLFQLPLTSYVFKKQKNQKTRLILNYVYVCALCVGLYNFSCELPFPRVGFFFVVVVLFSFLLLFFFLDRILLCNFFFFFQDLRGEGCVCIYVCDMWVPVYMTAFRSQFSSPTLLG